MVDASKDGFYISQAPTCTIAMNDDGPRPPGEGIVKWVTPEWLEAHLDSDITVVDVQPNIHDYIQEHIPGRCI